MIKSTNNIPVAAVFREKYNLFYQKSKANDDPLPPTDITDVGMFCGIKHESESLYLLTGYLINTSEAMVFMYANLIKQKMAPSQCYVILCTVDAWSNFEAHGNLERKHSNIN